jgi:hypothetical protein
MRPFAAICILAAGFPLAGCDIAQHVLGAINPDTVSLSDRCAEFMTAAMPFADIAIDTRTAENSGINTIIARVAGRRTDHSADRTIARDLAVECQFDGGVLTDFHWTKGAPQH